MVGSIGVKVQELAQLLLDALLIVAQSRFVEQIALLRLARRVTDHTRSATDQRQRLVAATLEMTQNHHTAQVSDVQRIGCRVDTQISRYHFSFGQ